MSTIYKNKEDGIKFVMLPKDEQVGDDYYLMEQVNKLYKVAVQVETFELNYELEK